MKTRPLTLREARPMVWMSERGLRRNPSLSASKIDDERHLGQVETLAQQVDAHEHVELAEPQIAEDVDALERVDVRVEVAHADAELAVVVREVLRHALGERRHQDALVLLARGA